MLKLGVGDGRGFARLNRALITLIPKKQDAVEIGDYRPISLVHSFAKLFSKVVANRLRLRLGDIVSTNQSAFVKHRCLHDNFVLVRQVARRINEKRKTGVLLKLALSRAFDSMSWGFLFEVLRQMGFGPLFRKWVALLLYTANTKIIVNGVPGMRIQHARGLRQGDPTSPMLFVIGMEVLTAMVTKAANEQIWRNLTGILPLQRISIYADDVVMFLSPVREELWAAKELLQIFGEVSGLKVNYQKTTATLIRGSEEEEDLVRSTLGCQVTNFPIRYLGLQLALRPLTRAEWQPLLDSVVHFLPAWQRGLIARAGRLMLIKTVISARPIHHILVAEPPAWLLEEVVKYIRGFFWVGKKQANGGQCLVAWDNICKPTHLGGLGVKDLRLHGLALRVRWEWLQRTDPSRPWQGLKMMHDTEASKVFQSLTKITAGDGSKVWFWRDRWINGRAVEDIAPLVVQLVPTRKRNSRTVAQALLENTWISDIEMSLTVEGCAQCIKLWEELEGLQRDTQQPDSFTWIGSTSGLYTAKDTYNLLCQGGIEFNMHGPLWKSFAPLKCKIFTWLALRNRLWTSDRRWRHGLQDHSEACFTCLQGEDTVNHVLVQCPYARQVWFGCLIAAGLHITEPTTDCSLESWWEAARRLVRKRDRRSFDTLVILSAWSIWKQRNARVFHNTGHCNPHQLIDKIKAEFILWKSAKVGGSSVMPRE
jgi:hypothetical protein